MSNTYIDWEVVLGELQVVTDFPDAYYLEDLKDAAKSWKSDPCANLDDDLFRGPDNEPKDPPLREFGLLFGDYIELMSDPKCTLENLNGLANGALVILSHIELRAKKVLEWTRRKS